jgi:hypothetical protein
VRCHLQLSFFFLPISINILRTGVNNARRVGYKVGRAVAYGRIDTPPLARRRGLGDGALRL